MFKYLVNEQYQPDRNDTSYGLKEIEHFDSSAYDRKWLTGESTSRMKKGDKFFGAK